MSVWEGCRAGEDFLFGGNFQLGRMSVGEDVSVGRMSIRVGCQVK